MLDTKYLRDNLETVALLLQKRGFQLDIQLIKNLEAQRKTIQAESQRLQNERNLRSKAVGLAKARGEDVTKIFAEVSEINDQLKVVEVSLEPLQNQLQSIYDALPNIPHVSVPEGKSEDDNVLIRTWGKPTSFNFTPKDHVALGSQPGNNGIDFETAANLSGARFVILQDKFAKLHRALAQFMLDLHTEHHGYTEVYVPYLVSGHCLYGTGQLPKFSEDQFALKDSDLWLIPTAEVSVTNFLRDQIIEEKSLPKKFVCHSPCFRKEAGTYGKDMKGMLRQHQFDKVEMVQFVTPENSYEALEEMVMHAETVLQKLQLPYQVMSLCTTDIGFSAAKTYDLEVWLPGQNRYREISSCSNTEAFQARRMQARYRSTKTNKPEYLHTLNGSGLAVGRTFIAIVENYQDEKGRIHIPDVLRSYMGGLDFI